MKIESSMFATGRFRAVVHKGHTYDEQGNIVEEGEVVVRDGVPQETQFGRNKLKLLYFTDMFAAGSTILGCFVAGAGNTTPVEANGPLTSYLGKCTRHLSATLTYSDTPDADGYVYLRTVFRATFAPGAFGTGSKNVSEGGIAKGDTGNVTNTTNLYAHGLLVDAGGSPTSVSVDTGSEYLDMFWEYTRYFKAEQTGTVTLNILGVPTEHAYVLRPSNWRVQSGTSTVAWYNDTFFDTCITLYRPFGLSMDTSNQWTATQAISGPLGALTGFPTHTGYVKGHIASVLTRQTQTNPKVQTWLVRWSTTAGNVPGGIGGVYLNGSDATSFQCSFDPKIDKTSDQQLDLYFTMTLDNKP